MSLIEKYEIKESGYHPFLIREGWQVAQLNYEINQKIQNIKKLEVHNHTDEVFILMKGRAVLISAKIDDSKPQFELEVMRPGITYNVPRKTWHNIAMEKKCEVIIVEKSNTHQNDVAFFQLTDEEYLELKGQLQELAR